MDLLYQDFEMPEYLPETIDNNTILPTEALINNPIEDHKQENSKKFQLETSMDEGDVGDLFLSSNEDDIIENILLTLSELNPKNLENVVNSDSSQLDGVLSDQNRESSCLREKLNNEIFESVSSLDQEKSLEANSPSPEQGISQKMKSVESTQCTRNRTNEGEYLDVSNMTEKELSSMQTRKIIDKSCKENDPAFAINSLPENLMIKATWKSDALGRPYIDVVGAFAKEYIPVGTRFGPLVGQRYELNNEPADKSNCWKVFEDDNEFIVDLRDDTKANWIKYVKPAYKSSAQNLVAYQEGKEVFFLTIKPVNVDEEITFWFCKEYSERLKCPVNGDLMMEHMKQQQQQLQLQQQQLLQQQQQWQQVQDQSGMGLRSSASPDSGYTGSPPPAFTDSKIIHSNDYPEAEVLYGDTIDNPSRKNKVTLVLHHNKSQHLVSRGEKFCPEVGPLISGNKESRANLKNHGNQEHITKNRVPNNGNGGSRTNFNPQKKIDNMFDREYKCKDCGKIFRQLSNLDTHMRIHNGERPFKCEICEKGFTQKAHKEKHILIHTGEKPYECVWPGCGKKFSSSSNLKTHEKIHEGKKDFVCEICTLAFSQAVHLKQHIGIHNNERPFVCQPCGKEYISDSALKTHKKKKNCGQVTDYGQVEQQKLQQRLMQQWQKEQQWQQQWQHDQHWQQIPWQQQQIKREIC